jgi:hypothetical protein
MQNSPVSALFRDTQPCFAEFVRRRVNNPGFRNRNSISHMMKGIGDRKADTIIRYDHLKEDLGALLKSRGINNIDVDKLPHIRHGNKNYSRDYKKYYDPKTRKLVEEAFAEDIKTFGFRFENL